MNSKPQAMLDGMLFVQVDDPGYAETTKVGSFTVHGSRTEYRGSET